ncbi:hypothetical protein DDZ15_14150 [Rhodohalobacter mucosus]|uniref:Uncharacterized protein n=1 Tax=Rhodohalobacter mucosus TaxID=2079485 RepID=A0A316TMA3_9BACT|nr:hypothetical protein DDZ15_14150 [Rhodohalobacter mucosus]
MVAEIPLLDFGAAEFGLNACKWNTYEYAMLCQLQAQSAGWRIKVNSPGRKPGEGWATDPDNAGWR